MLAGVCGMVSSVCELDGGEDSEEKGVVYCAGSVDGCKGAGKECGRAGGMF
jgi:hypothetical protein